MVIGNEGQQEVILQARPKKIFHERKICFLDGKDLYMADDFDAPLPVDLLAGFGYK